SASSPLSQTVNQASTTTALSADSSNPSPSTYGQTLSFTATVSNASATGAVPTGTVSFFNGSTKLGTARLTRNAPPTLRLPALAAGTSSITATYNVSPAVASTSSPAAAPLSQTVNQASTSTTLSADSSNPSPATYGQTLSFTATVSNTSGT